MADASVKRRGDGEDAIYFEWAKNRHVGAVSLDYAPDGKRIRRKVPSSTKQEVPAKLKARHDDEILITISWRAKSEQIAELRDDSPFTTVLITNAPSNDLAAADYTLICRPVSDLLLGGIPAESVLETLTVGYQLIASATTPSERVRALRKGHPHGELGTPHVGGAQILLGS